MSTVYNRHVLFYLRYSDIISDFRMHQSVSLALLCCSIAVSMVVLPEVTSAFPGTPLNALRDAQKGKLARIQVTPRILFLRVIISHSQNDLMIL